MVDHRQDFIERRSIGRRDEDYQTFRFKQISRVGQIIMSEMNLDILLDLIMEQTVQILEAERCTVFLYDGRTDQLWSKSATGIGKERIRIPTNRGVASWVFNNREALIINDAYGDDRFYAKVDTFTGFLTRNILCIPLVNKSNDCMGVLQVLNKKSGDFSRKDQNLLVSISHYIAIAIENANLYEGIMAVSEAREKVIDHLSHELRTPVAIIDTALKSISKVLPSDELQKIERPINRCQRNLTRLRNMQTIIADILNNRTIAEKKRLTDLVETFYSLMEETSEVGNALDTNFYDQMMARLDSIYRQEPFTLEEINLSQFLSRVRSHAISNMGPRNPEILLKVEQGLNIMTDRKMLSKVCSGLLRNAIEATPDEGRIAIEAKQRNGQVIIAFQDRGVGITPENQRSIFNGFYHTQDSNYYASKQPYAFYAGGSGSDLLRVKVFSERHGFSIKFSSACCRFIPGDKNMCPGKISDCQFIKSPSECYDSGGSTFSLEFS